MTTDDIRKIGGELRGNTFASAIELASEIGVKCIVETGTWRGCDADGQSTRLLGTVAQELGADFYSVDISQYHIDISTARMKELGLAKVQHSCCDSVFFLSLFQSPIQFLYLDSYDYSYDVPMPAQIHQVAEIGAAWGKLVNKVIVLLDDCNITGGGKGLLTTQFLKSRGWKLRLESYQNLLTNF